jgi:hypothetical protein
MFDDRRGRLMWEGGTKVTPRTTKRWVTVMSDARRAWCMGGVVRSDQGSTGKTGDRLEIGNGIRTVNDMLRWRGGKRCGDVLQPARK